MRGLILWFITLLFMRLDLIHFDIVIETFYMYI
jgi:hypothetical protein